MDRRLAEFPEVERVFGKMGRARSATDSAPIGMVETVISLKPRDQWREGLTWDGTPRIDRFLTDYCGAVEDEYTRAVTRQRAGEVDGRGRLAATTLLVHDGDRTHGPPHGRCRCCLHVRCRSALRC